MNTQTDTAPLCSSSEARALVRALNVLDAIDKRAGGRSYGDTDANPAYLGRVAGSCGIASRALFGAFSSIGIYGESPQAAAAMQRYLRRNDD